MSCISIDLFTKSKAFSQMMVCKTLQSFAVACVPGREQKKKKKAGVPEETEAEIAMRTFLREGNHTVVAAQPPARGHDKKVTGFLSHTFTPIPVKRVQKADVL